MSGYNRCECGSILNHYNIENPLYINESITNNKEKIEIKDEELIAKLQLNFLETEKCKKLLSYIKKSSNKKDSAFTIDFNKFECEVKKCKNKVFCKKIIDQIFCF